MLALYDAALGRFLSPDPYVQMPDFTQNFNQYFYCLNNPLVYEDGEFIHLIIGAVVRGVANVISNWKTIKEKGFWTGVGYFSVGAVAGTLSAGVGAGISSALVSGGSFSAGGSVGFVTGFGNGLFGGKSFRQSLGQGALYGLGGAASGALVGGLWGGIDAYRDGRNFMHGERVVEEISMPLPQMNQVRELDCRYEVFRSNDTYYNGSTRSVADLRNQFPNVETSDAAMSKMYGSKRLSLLKLDTSNLSKIDMAKDIASHLSKNNSVIYEMRISDQFAHAVSRVRIYDRVC